MGAARPRLAHFLQLFGYAGPTKDLNPLLDDVRSQWPWDSTSGWSASVSVNSQVALVAAVSSWWFKPETVIALGGSVPNIVRFYDGNLSRALFDLYVSGSVNVFVDRYKLRGVFCVSGLYVSIQSGMTIRAGGLLIESMATGPI